MTTLSEIIRNGYAAYRNSVVSYSASPVLQRFEGLEVKGLPAKPCPDSVYYSNFSKPIDSNPNRLSGYGRGWGQASNETQRKVIELILNNSKHLSPENRAILLATARLESGFNPDAATPTTSASGVFQIIKTTGNKLGLPQEDIFDAQENVAAGVKLFEENLAAVARRYPRLSGDERAVMLYAFHHDGPSLSHGGAAIARKNLVPYLDEFRAVTYGIAFNEAY